MATKSIISLVPTFLLRKVDPQRIYDQYREGKYQTIEMPTEKLTVTTITNTLQPTVGVSSDSDIYAFQTKANTLQTVITTNHPQYVLFNTQGHPVLEGGTCDWCRQEFKHRALGIPIRLEEHVINDQKVSVYYLDGCMCSFECCLAELKRNYRQLYRYRDPLYMDSEQLLRHLHSQVHPNRGFLREAPDYRLLRHAGGALEHHDFHDRKQVYERTPNIVLAPIKVEYLKYSLAQT
jgi:hypothetical protein